MNPPAIVGTTGGVSKRANLLTVEEKTWIQELESQLNLSAPGRYIGEPLLATFVGADESAAFTSK